MFFMRRILTITNVQELRRADKAAAIYAYAARHGWDIHAVSPGTLTDLDVIVRQVRPDGIIVEGATERKFRFPRIPTVHLDTDDTSARHTVASDSDAIATLAFDELTRQRPAHLLFVSTSAHRRWSEEREQAIRKLCKRAKLPFSAVRTDSDTTEAVDAFAKALAGLPTPLAAFACHDNAAIRLYAAAKQCGLSISTDLRIVSVGNNPVYVTNLKPALTSVELDSRLAGRCAAELLDRLMATPQLPTEHLRIAPTGIVRRASSLAGQTNRGIATAEALIRERACSGLSVDDVRKAMGVSRRTAETAFLRMTGTTINEAILSIRFEEVRRLLRNPELTLGTIANMCGWQSQSHLARAFRARYGQTMSACRLRSRDQTTTSSAPSFASCGMSYAST